jgi:TonB-linked SusC/RagA family outer membrane protein
MRRNLLSVAIALLSIAGARAGAQTQQGTITGRVTDAATNQPIPTVALVVVGTTNGTQSNADGQYTIRAVTAGSVEVRVLRVGYVEQRQRATVTAGQSTTLDIRMAAVPMTLNPVVTTATGEQRRIEVGNSIAQVNASEVLQKSAVTNMADLLTSRAAGVMVVPGTQTGAGVRVRIRGTSSLSLTNNPIYVVDGIRVEGATGSSSVSVGGTTPSRINDLNPQEIENIEVVRGPSASTLYGTDAANGVIVITTKRGLAGRAQLTYITEQTAITDRNKYPDAFWGWRTGTTAATTSTPSNTVQCFLSQVASNACKQDSVTSYNLHEDPDATPYGVGYRQAQGLQLRGGTDAIRYFMHGQWEDETGRMKVPEFDKRYLSSRGLGLRPDEKSPSHMGRVTGRSNVSFMLPGNVDIAVNAGYTSEELRIPRSDDSGVSGVAANTYGGPGFKYNLSPAGDTLYGWRQFTPRDIYQGTTEQGIQRLISSVQTNWRPSDWLAVRGNFGLDYTNRTDSQICRFAECPDVGTDRQGFKIDNRTNFFVYTVDAGATATRRIVPTLESKTAVGFQFYRNVFDRNGATGTTLPPGAQTVTAGAVKSADESTAESRTLGAYVEQSMAWRDRFFATGAVRTDRNSAFGADFRTAFYPKLSLSWVVSDESFFPKMGWMNQIRLRSAYGASGVQPGTTDAVQYFSSTRALGESGEVPGVVFSTLGNRELKPERSTELELGLDGNFWDNRISSEITYYTKASRDALVSRIIPPSLGTGATARRENLGEVHNWGWEARVTAQVLQMKNIGWDLTLNGSTNANELVSLGNVPPIIGTTQHNKPGYPLNGWWSRRLLGYQDKNNNGIIEYNANATLSEIVVSDTAEFFGYPVPRHEVAMISGFDFWQRRIRVSGMVDYKGGYYTYNNTERIRCLSRNNCSGLINPQASLSDQARVVMGREHPSRSVSGYFEDGSFIRFRELSITMSPSDTWTARYLRGRRLDATVAVRNLGILWTKYSGVDPEAFGTTGDAPSEFQAFAPPTYLSFRLSLGF